jgi:eukaryotic-like serine/threonine-protein kinase
MTPERHRQIKDIFESVMKCEPAARAAFLAEACAGDEALRAEVESLIACDEAAGSFIDAPVYEQAAEIIAGGKARSIVGQRLGRYQLRDLLGAGGMGEVYRARDTRLEREVAVKILPSHLAEDPMALARFEREAKAVAALSHSNILSIFDIGSAEGINYAVMELLEGETLRARLARSALSVREALEIGLSVAAGLQAAHAKGITHRDLKPENIFLTSERGVKILDFGIARMKPAVLPGVGTADSTVAGITRPGTLIGTMGYMSPEQARGERVDERSDIFSLGIVLYEMATGRGPFEGVTPSDVIAALLSREPQPLTQLLPEAPVEFERIVSKTLRKERDERYQTVKDLLIDLKSLSQDQGARARGSTVSNAEVTALRQSSGAWPASDAVEPNPSGDSVEKVRHSLEARRGRRGVNPRLVWFGVAFGLAMVLGATVWFLTKSKALRGSDRFSRQTAVAVLPFQNVAKDSAVEYLSTALPDEVITTLSYAPTLSVRPFSMSQQFSAEKADPQSVGQQLRVSKVITGRFRQQGDRVGITLEATDVATDEITWYESLDVSNKDVLTLRQELTTALQKGLLPALSVSKVELSRTKPTNQEAYELYLRSQDSAYQSMALNKEATAMLERSIALDPGYAPSWVALGLHYMKESDFASGGDEEYHKSVAALERAHQLDPDLLAASTLLIERRAFYEDLASSFMQILELANRHPHTAVVHDMFSALLRAAGALSPASRECEVVHQLDPEFPSGGCIVTYLKMADYAKARKEIERSPSDFATMMLGQILLREGKVEEAIPKLKSIPAGMQFELLRDCWPDSSTAKCDLAAKQSESSFRAITFSEAWHSGAAVLAFVNHKDGAIRLLRAANEHNLCIYPAVDFDPLFDKIRSSAEFKEVRLAGIDCQRRFASYAQMQID